MNDLNGQVEHYKQIIAQRQGIAAAGNESNNGTGEVIEVGDGEITPQPF